MEEPRRLSDIGDDFQRTLLESARADVGSAAAEARALSAVSHPATLVSGVKTALGLKAALLGSIGVAVVAASWLLLPSPPQQRPHVAEKLSLHVESADAAVSAPGPADAAVSAPEPSAPPESAHEPARPLAAPIRARRAPHAPTARTYKLAEEVALLQCVQRALAAHESAEALGQLARYRRDFAHGALALEAEVLHVQALLEHGELIEGHALGERFLRDHPEGLHAKKVRALLQARPIP